MVTEINNLKSEVYLKEQTITDITRDYKELQTHLKQVNKRKPTI